MALDKMDMYAFLNNPTVFSHYAYIRKFSLPDLKKMLPNQAIDSPTDDAHLRIKLLLFVILQYHPNIEIPWGSLDGISNNEAARLWLVAEGFHDLRDFYGELGCKASSSAADRVAAKETQTNMATFTTVDTNNKKSVKATIENAIFETRLKYLKSLRHWGLQFSGKTGQAAKKFLDNLKDFRKFSQINDRVLLDMLPCILDDTTKTWYRAKNFTSWEVFEPSFLNALVLLRDEEYERISRPEASQNVDLQSTHCLLKSKTPSIASVEHENSLYNDSEDSVCRPKTCSSPDLYPNLPRVYRSSSYCLAALKNKSSKQQYASSLPEAFDKNSRDGASSVIDEMSSSSSSSSDSGSVVSESSTSLSATSDSHSETDSTAYDPSSSNATTYHGYPIFPQNKTNYGDSATYNTGSYSTYSYPAYGNSTSNAYNNHQGYYTGYTADSTCVHAHSPYQTQGTNTSGYTHNQAGEMIAPTSTHGYYDPYGAYSTYY